MVHLTEYRRESERINMMLEEYRQEVIVAKK